MWHLDERRFPDFSVADEDDVANQVGPRLLPFDAHDDVTVVLTVTSLCRRF